MTKIKKKQIAYAIKSFLDQHFLNGDCRIYFNGICFEHGREDDRFTWVEEKKDFVEVPDRTPWKTIEDIDPHDFFEYCTGVVSVSFEGSLYEVLNGYSKRDFELQDELRDLLQKYCCHYELGNSWNLSVYED